ncbi:hypothetical protein AALB81_18315 [Lachnospiraceae bacterium 48-33]
MNKFRELRADEIDCRIASVKSTGLSILLYKDARCDQNILDETVGPMNWMRHHRRDNANCTVAIWDEEKGQWIEKEDTGKESNSEAEKGLASDSFKRACFNWGIGRELYTAPFIWFSEKDCNIKTQNGKMTCYDKFECQKITYENGRIIALTVENISTGKTFSYSYKGKAGQNTEAEPEQYIEDEKVSPEKKQLLKETGIKYKVNIENWLKTVDRTWDTLTNAEATRMIEAIMKKHGKETCAS